MVKLKELMFYPGSNIDVINVPSLVIDDAVGTGATGYAAIKGSVTGIELKNLVLTM